MGNRSIVDRAGAARAALLGMRDALSLLDLAGLSEDPATAHLQIAYDQLRGIRPDPVVALELDRLESLDAAVCDATTEPWTPTP